MPVNVMVIQPGMLLRQALVASLESAGEIRVVRDCDSANQAIQSVDANIIDLIVIDAFFLTELGTGVLSDLRETYPASRQLIVADQITQPQVERALAAGADGFTLKIISMDEFVDTVRRVAAGEVVLHPAIASLLVKSLSAFTRGERSAGPILTGRQQEIVRLLALGLPNKQIARRLGIGVETVKTHISKILAKLGVASRTEAVLVAVRHGVLGVSLMESNPVVPIRHAN